ncbi:MAG TPA: histidine triad nucleotide-binding protein [Gemmatimonadota bacterium]|jgi:histidine triad (HIT) family protein
MSEASCVFCKIVRGEIDATLLHRDDGLVAFRDLSPKAPFHALVVPTRHLETLDELEEGDADLVGRMLLRGSALAREQGLTGGYRLVLNCGPDGGQSVFHVHLHVLGGRRMTWPPG